MKSTGMVENVGLQWIHLFWMQLPQRYLGKDINSMLLFMSCEKILWIKTYEMTDKHTCFSALVLVDA